MEQGIDELIKALIPEALNRLPKDINSFHFKRNLRKEEMEHEIDEIIEGLVSCIWMELNKINNTDNICLLREDLGKEEIEEKIGKTIEAVFHTVLTKIVTRGAQKIN